ncbi:trypsin-like serine protease [Candidatus Poribacteria bacterium]|nr:trypsin-like serine protease [Candidatus Poribacteria bacterium]
MKKVYQSLIVCLLTTSLFLPNTFAQDSAQWHLPQYATARFGKGWVKDIKFSPYSDQLAVATTIGVWIYDVRTGKEQVLFSGIMGGANAVSYSPGGLMLAAAHWDQTVRLWDTNTGNHRPLSTFTGHNGEIHAVAFSPDGSMLASGSADNTIRVWNVNTEALMAILPYNSAINTIDFSQDSQMIAGGSEDGTIQVWDAGTGDRIYEFHGHTDSVWEIDFSPNGQILISASLDGTVQLWNLVAPGGRLDEPTQHNMPIYAVNFSQDGRNFATSGADSEIRVWDTNTRELTSTLTGHNDIVPTVTLSPDGTTLASGSLDGTVRLWNMRLFQKRLELKGHTGGVKALTHTEDNRILACGTGLDNKLRLWDASTGRQLSKLQDHSGLTEAVAFSKNGKTLVSAGSENGAIFISDLSLPGEDSLQTTLTGNTLGITALALSPAETILASGGADGRIYLLDVQNRTELQILRGAQSTITALTFVFDGNHLFSGEENGMIRRWNSTGQEMWSGRGAFTAITALAFSPTADFLAIGDKVGQIWLFDFREDKVRKIRIFTHHTQKMTALIFSSDSNTLISGSEDGTILLWNVNEVLRNADESNIPPSEGSTSVSATIPQERNTMEQTAQEIAKKALASTVALNTLDANGKSVGYGSGFFVHPGHIATNYHVIKQASKMYFKSVGDETTYWVEDIAATDPTHDLALLRVSSLNTPVLSLADSDSVQIGEDIYAVGNPRGWEGTVSDGIVSSIRGEGDNKWIQITAPISPGNSGGAVLNSKGEVIGIATSGYQADYAQNLHFAVPSNYLKALLQTVE